MPPTVDTERKRAWGHWFDDTLTRLGLRNRDVVARLKEAGAGDRWTPATISEWRSGKTAPTETAALFIAKALGLPGPLVLRAAGHRDAADLIEEAPRGDDPLVARIRRSGLSDPSQAQAEEFVRGENEALSERLDRLLSMVRYGEQLTALDQSKSEHDDGRNAS